LSRIYLAGKWEEAATIKQYADELRLLGHTITMPWFETHVLGQEDLTQSAIEDDEGVKTADYAIFIFEKPLSYGGAYTELGLAIAYGRRVFVVGHAGDKNIFTNHPSVKRAETWTEAKQKLDHYSPPKP
jgi:hypothetical protein